MGGRKGGGGGGGAGGEAEVPSFTHDGITITGVSKMPRTQAEWDKYDELEAQGIAAPLRSLEGTYMSEQYLKQSLVKKKKGWVINRDDPNRYYPTKKAALEWIGDSTAELRASQGGGK